MLDLEPVAGDEIDCDTIEIIKDLLSAHEWDRAKDLCFTALSVHRSADVLNLVGFVFFQTGDYEKAIAYCSEAHAVGIDDWNNQFIIGLCWKLLGRFDKAIDAFKIAYGKESLSIDVVLEILRCYDIVGNLAAWRSFYENIHHTLKTHNDVEYQWQIFFEKYLIDHIKSSANRGHLAEARRRAQELLRAYPKMEYRRTLDHIDFHAAWLARRQDQAARESHKATLSVLLITYNHEKFVARALDSILDQITDCKINIVVMEDCSTDSTATIVKDYERRYPEIIKAYCNEKNIGTLDPPQQKVTFQGLKLLTADYFAILEGDDYWSSRHKVQIQISFLEQNALYVATAHNTVKIYEDASSEPHRFLYWKGIKSDHTIVDMITYSFFHSSSLMFRNFFRGEVPDCFKSKWSCDIFMSIFATQFGNIRYFDTDMSVYRAHGGGSYSNLTAINGDIFNIRGYIYYNAWLKFRYTKEFALQISRRCEILKQREGFAELGFANRLTFAAIGILVRIAHSLLSKFPTLNPAARYDDEPIKEASR